MGDPEKAQVTFPLEFQQEIQEGALGQDVQSRGGFIEDEQLRVAGQGHGQADPLALPPADFQGEAIQEPLISGQPQSIQQGPQPRQGFPAGFLPMNTWQEGQLFSQGEQGVQGFARILGNPGQPGSPDVVAPRPGPVHGHPEGLDGTFTLVDTLRQGTEQGAHQETFA
jgi:hypothetical protein